jgi:hypothetical protein
LILGLVYALTWVFDPQRTDLRNAAFAWIDKDLLFQADRISLAGAQGLTELRRKKGLWVIEEGGKDLPVKQGRVDDFLSGLGRRGVYPVRASSARAAERLGVGDDSASRIIIRGGAGLPLLDLLIGWGGATGREIYLRKAGRNEVRSGEDRFTQYVDSPRSSWYDLRLFPVPPGAAVSVQRVRVSAFNGAAPYTLSRSGGAWSFEGEEEIEADPQKAESWVRSIMDAEGEDFKVSAGAGEAGLDEGSLALEFGDGSVKTIRVGPPSEDGRRDAAVFPSPEGSGLVYRLAERTAGRLFREAGYFKR